MARERKPRKKAETVVLPKSQTSYWRNIKKYWPLYLMVIPGTVFLLLFRFIPLMGSVIAFQDYSVFKGFLDQEFVGFKHFIRLFNYEEFWSVFSNTLVLGFCKTILIFPIPVILAIMLNEVRGKKVKKGIQTIIYIPHFLSWVIIGGLVFDFFGVGGIFNIVREALGMETKLVMQQSSWFRPIFVISSIWKESGWGTIVYLAAISGIDVSLYEAAVMDGASRFQRMRYITFPLLVPTILTLFLLNIGGFLEMGFEQIYSLLTPMTRSVGEVFDTYVYRVGIQQGQYSFTTAVGLFQSVIGLTLVTIFNKLSNKLTDDGGLW